MGGFVSLDLADVIERTRLIKRKLCQPPLSLEPDFVFSGDFINLDHMIELKQRVDERSDPSFPEVITELNAIIAAISAGPDRPNDFELCSRYSQGTVDARTVIHITGWSVVDLYDQCETFGFTVPDFRS